MIPRKNIKDLKNRCREAYKDAESIIHGWVHAYRVAEEAKWLVKMKNKPKEQQDLAYIAGLLHDIVRPIDEERCHAEASAEKGRGILTDLNFEDHHISKICKAVKDHRYPKEDWDSTLHQSVFLADEIFEQMGAYMDFRGCVWVGEEFHTSRKDPEECVETILKHYEEGYSRYFDREFVERMFPEFTVPIALYQLKWNERFKTALKDGESWAEDMVERLVEKGKNKMDFEDIIVGFETRYPEQVEWKEEATSYIDGGLVSSKFKTMLKN